MATRMLGAGWTSASTNCTPSGPNPPQSSIFCQTASHMSARTLARAVIAAGPRGMPDTTEPGPLRN
eukprot:576736-Pyramimonas_sp.AAC.1